MRLPIEWMKATGASLMRDHLKREEIRLEKERIAAENRVPTRAELERERNRTNSARRRAEDLGLDISAFPAMVRKMR